MWENKTGKTIYADKDGKLVPEGPDAAVQVVAEGGVISPKDAQKYGLTEEQLGAKAKSKSDQAAQPSAISTEVPPTIEGDSGDEAKGSKALSVPAGTKAESEPKGSK